MPNMMYVHYWFADYEGRAGSMSREYLKLNELKNKYRQQYFNKIGMEEFNKRFNTANKANIDEFDDIMNFLTNENSEQRKKVFEATATKNVSTAKMLDEVKQSNIGDTKIVDATAEEIAAIVTDFCSSLKNIIESMYQELDTGKNWDEFVQEVVNEYQNRRNVSNSTFANRLISDFLTHKGLVKLNLNTNSGGKSGGDAALQTSLRNIALLVKALPEYGNGEEGRFELKGRRYSTGSTKGKYKNSGSGGQTLSIISGKLQGLFNNIVGKAGELAWAVAEEKGEAQLREAISKLNLKIKSEVVSIDEDPELSNTSKNAKNNRSTVKPDVKVQVKNGDQVVVEYGVSVKTYKTASSGAKVNSITLVTGANFLEAAERAFGSKNLRYMFNVAGGHPGHGSRNKGKIDDSYSINYTTAELNTQWQAIVDYVTTQNFLDVIAGSIKDNELPVIYLVVNGDIIPIAKVLQFLGESGSGVDFSTRLYNDKGTGRMLQRAKLMNMNEWKWKSQKWEHKNRYKDKDPEYGIKRSIEVEESLANIFRSYKLHVTLNGLQNLINN